MNTSTHRVLKVAVAALLYFAGGLPASAFDTQAHYDITDDALAAEGFGQTATQVAQVSNWFNDLYENASKNPYSGHAHWLIRFFVPGEENWPDAVVNAADRMHFDSASEIIDTAHAAAEWDRLARATRDVIVERAGNFDFAGALVALGSSLHTVQDFYAHTNWVEPRFLTNFDGPGWQALSAYGSHPTWFDVPATERARHPIYSSGKRSHGSWRSWLNKDGFVYMNKDCAGRPYYTDAYVSAYFASRQWVQAVRSWLNNDTLWIQIQRFSDRHGIESPLINDDLDKDLDGMTSISFFSGHWNGNGEPWIGENPGPGGGLYGLAQAIRRYFPGRTFFRQKWEDLIVRMADPNPPTGDLTVPSSMPAQGTTEFLMARIDRMRQLDNMDTDYGGGIFGADIDEADFYARATIGGQEFRSGLFSGHDDVWFSFPYGAFTFIKSFATNGPDTTDAEFRLYDSDGFIYGDDDHADISPTEARNDLQLLVNRKDLSFIGDATGAGRASVQGNKGLLDGPRAQVSVEFQTLRTAQPQPPLPKYKVTVTFLEAKLTDATRPGENAQVVLGFDVNGKTARYPASGAAQPAIGSTFDLGSPSIKVTPEYGQNLVVTVVLEDAARTIPLNVPNPVSGKPQNIYLPLSLSFNRITTRETRFGEGTYTDVSPTDHDATLEVTYRIEAAEPIFRPDLTDPGTNLPDLELDDLGPILDPKTDPGTTHPLDPTTDPGTALPPLAQLPANLPRFEDLPISSEVPPLGEKTPPALAAATADPIPGDLNGDGQVTVADASLALRIVVGDNVEPTERSGTADLNADGQVTVHDAVRVLRLSLGL
jgi:hypothetical protein